MILNITKRCVRCVLRGSNHLLPNVPLEQSMGIT
jgi:hypothetical protein